MPRLRLQAYLDGHVIGADLIEQIVEFIKRAESRGRWAQGTPQTSAGRPQTSGGHSDARVCCPIPDYVVFCYITDNDITFVSGCRVIFLNGTISETNEWYHRYTSVGGACGRIRGVLFRQLPGLH